MAALVATIATGAMAGDCFVTVREEVMPVRDGRDRWIADWDASFVYTNGEGRVFFKENKFCLYHRGSYPGGERLRGAAEYVVRIEPQLEGEAELDIRRERKGWARSIKAKIGKETHFVADLPVDDEAYYLGSVKFWLKGVPPTRSVRFLGVDAVMKETPASALRVDVETGNPFRLVRDGTGEKAELVLRNPSDRKLDWNAHLKVEDFFGKCIEGDFPVSLEAGGVLRRPMKEALPKGIRYVTLIATSEGTVATNRTTWAYIDRHEVTPLQPEGEFRLGTHFHGTRYTPGDMKLGVDALVAIGAKMVRVDGPHQIGGIWMAEDRVDWTASDAVVDMFLGRGLAIDTIVWWPTPWAAEKDAGGQMIGSIRPGLLRQYGEMLARHYGKRIDYYEVGNEWDMTKPAWLPYEDAVRQVREFAEGVKSACPTAKVIPGGFACESSVRQPSHVIRPMFHEDLMRDIQDVVDAHPVHLHSNFKEFAEKLNFFLQWRKECNINLPWYANETAISTTAMRPNDRAAAVILWQKVLYAWSRGSLDYIWYNLRATGWNPADSEQGYGMFTADWRPRTAVAAFSAIAANFRHLRADGVLHNGRERQVMRFSGRRGGKDVCVIAGWDGFAEKPMSIRVRTDAKKAYQVDTMGNRCEVAIKGGVALWSIDAYPSALYLEDCRSAAPDAADLANEAKRPVQVIVPSEKANPILEFEKNRHLKTDILINSYDNVYEVFKAMPEHADRCWKWWGDLWVRVNFARTDSKVWMNINCWDDVHVPDFDHPLEGDAVVLRLGDWKVQLVGSSKRCEVKILEKPKGASDPKDGWAKLTFKPGYENNYFFEFDPAALGFRDEVPFNIRVYDNDGKGFDGWMEYAPLDGAECPVLLEL